MIQTAIGFKDLPYIIHLNTAKEAWESLVEIYLGNESMKRNKQSALCNQAEGFMKLPNEDHQEMYKWLLSIATAFRNVGADHINDRWIKEKYVEALMPYEAQDLKTLKGRHNFYEMTSHELMQEMQAFKVDEKNAKDALNRAIGMAKGENLVLKMNVVEEVQCQDVPISMSCPEELKHDFRDHMAFAARTFWKDPSKAKEQNYQRRSSSSFKGTGVRSRSCYCQNKFHFVAECPYKPREDHGGRLILKKKGKDSKETKAPLQETIQQE